MGFLSSLLAPPALPPPKKKESKTDKNKKQSNKKRTTKHGTSRLKKTREHHWRPRSHSLEDFMEFFGTAVGMGELLVLAIPSLVQSKTFRHPGTCDLDNRFKTFKNRSLVRSEQGVQPEKQRFLERSELNTKLRRNRGPLGSTPHRCWKGEEFGLR